MNSPTTSNLTASPEKQKRAFTKAHQAIISYILAAGFHEPTNCDLRGNRYTNRAVLLEPKACLLFDFILCPCDDLRYMAGMYDAQMRPCQPFDRRMWDRARHLFLEMWPEGYYLLID